MIVLDTHAWFWWLSADRQLSGRAHRAIARDGDIRIPALVCWEVMLLADRQRTRLDKPCLEWVRLALRQDRTSLEPVSIEIAAQAVGYHAALGGDPVDCMVAATARVLDAPLVTRDERIAALPGVRAIW